MKKYISIMLFVFFSLLYTNTEARNSDLSSEIEKATDSLYKQLAPVIQEKGDVVLVVKRNIKFEQKSKKHKLLATFIYKELVYYLTRYDNVYTVSHNLYKETLQIIKGQNNDAFSSNLENPFWFKTPNGLITTDLEFEGDNLRITLDITDLNKATKWAGAISRVNLQYIPESYLPEEVSFISDKIWRFIDKLAGMTWFRIIISVILILVIYSVIKYHLFGKVKPGTLIIPAGTEAVIKLWRVSTHASLRGIKETLIKLFGTLFIVMKKKVIYSSPTGRFEEKLQPGLYLMQVKKTRQSVKVCQEYIVIGSELDTIIPIKEIINNCSRR